MTKNARSLWGRNIRRLVDARNAQDKVIAEKAGMSAQQFSNVINDPNLNPTIDTLQRVADALDVSLGELFSGVEEEGTGDARRSLSSIVVDPESLTGPLRTALSSVLVDMLSGLAEQSTQADESASGTRAEKAEGRRVPARTRGALR